MYYVYLLRSQKNGKFYTGSTADLRKRLKQHNNGSELSTKAYTPWKLLYYEAYATRSAAVLRENKLKHHGKGLSELKKRLSA